MWRSLGLIGSVAGVAGCQSIPSFAVLTTDARPADADESYDQNTHKRLGSSIEAGSSISITAGINPQTGVDDEVVYGSEEFVRTAVDGPIGDTKDQGVSFVFNRTPIEAVVYEVLGAGFGADYAIAPDVSGALSLNLVDVTTEEEAVVGLSRALATQSLTLEKMGSSYAVRRSRTERTDFSLPVFVDEDSALPVGASTAVIQIERAALNDVSEIAEALLPEETIKLLDQRRGMIVLEGEAETLRQSTAVLRSLDVDWLSAVSIALLPIENATPSELSGELAPIIERMGGVSIIPIERLGALMVVSRRRDGLDRVRDWVDRLDKAPDSDLIENTLIYEAKHVDAERLAAVARGQFTPIDDDGAGALLFDEPLDQVRPPPRQNATRSGAGLYQGISIQVDPGRNAIIARGEQKDLLSLSEIIKALDKPQRQVLIEATIVEVGLSTNNQFGIQWDAVEDNLRATFTDLPSGAVASLFPGLSVSYINTDVEFVVNALASTSDAEVISSPRLLVINNESARLQVGDQVPITTQSAVSVVDPAAPIVNSTNYRDTGVILTVTPSIRAGGMVELTVNQEVSNVTETTTSTIDSPTITQRSIDSRLAVPNGATAVLGGLMSTTRTYTETGIPLLKDIPLFGRLFRTQGEVERRTELVVLIEPTVMQSSDLIVDVPKRLREALQRARRETG